MLPGRPDSMRDMIRFTVTLLLLLALAFWSLPEFEKWGRHDRDEAMMQFQRECEYQVHKVASDGDDEHFNSKCQPFPDH